jgi:hypothetical protein
MEPRFYFVDSTNHRVGPVTWSELMMHDSNRVITDTTLVALEGALEWATFSELKAKPPLADVDGVDASAPGRPGSTRRKRAHKATYAVLYGIAFLGLLFTAIAGWREWFPRASESGNGTSPLGEGAHPGDRGEIHPFFTEFVFTLNTHRTLCATAIDDFPDGWSSPDSPLTRITQGMLMKSQEQVDKSVEIILDPPTDQFHPDLIKVLKQYQSSPWRHWIHPRRGIEEVDLLLEALERLGQGAILEAE